MADVEIDRSDWQKLRGSALFFVPAALEADATTPIDRKKLIAASESISDDKGDKALKLSDAALTSLFSQRPQGHAKCEAAVLALNLLFDQIGRDERFESRDITCAVFFAPKLKALMAEANMSASDFAKAGGHERDIALVEAMLERKRVPLTVGVRVARKLRSRLPKLHLREFLSTRHDAGLKAVPLDGKDTLFGTADLKPAWVEYAAWQSWREIDDLPSDLP